MRMIQALDSRPPIATAWDPTRSKSLREMPGVPVYEELGEEAGPRDQIENALWEMRREGQTIESPELAASQCSLFYDLRASLNDR